MKRAVFLTSGSQIAIQVIGLVTGIFVARWLGPDGRGQVAVVISWASMLAYLGNLGLPVALTYAAAKQQHLRHQLFGNGFLVALVQWLTLGLIGYFLLPILLGKHDLSLVHIAVLYLWAYLPINLLTLYANAIQQGSGHYARYNAVRISVPVGYAILLLLLWYMEQVSVETVVFVNILSNVITVILALILTLPPLLNLARKRPAPWVSVASLKKNIRFGLTSQIGSLQPFSGLRLDVLALTLLSTTQDIGLYMAALAGANLLRAQAYALGQVVLPEVAKHELRSMQWRIIRRFMLLAGAGSFIAFVIVLYGAVPLLRIIYGDAFTPASQILQVLVAAGSLGAVYRILADGLRGMGVPSISTKAELVGLFVGGAALAILIPIWGGVGAATAVLIASIASLTATLWMTFRQGGIGRDGSSRQIEIGGA